MINTHNKLGVFSLITCIILLQACGGKAPQKEAEERLAVISLKTVDTQVKQEYVADIEAVQNVEVRNKVSGFIEKIFVDEGQKVSQGQVLFQLNDSEYRAQLATATANLQTLKAEAQAAKLEVDRIQQLVDKKVVSNTELAMAQAKMAAAQAKVAEAQSLADQAALRLSHTIIKAPFDGTIDRIPFKQGSLLQDGTLLTTISSLGAVYAYFKVSEAQYLHYMRRLKKEGDNNINTVELLLADGTIYEYKGQIETLEGDFESSTGSIAFRAKFPNPDHLLRHNATGKVIITTPVDKALVVPQRAVFEIQDKSYVFVLGVRQQGTVAGFCPPAAPAQFLFGGLRPQTRRQNPL
ncbi:efflux RND transporter periplasmic adaptor subunit [Eisenibacter elegans]|uniref:efflux RND transporter periplasmic adaptor subunit n=1 Tax=Eisenibacter elegans TaxID=997 RepID=UPI000404996C|nr:efflux RND transporter periplasmic adaptor subunit [Eisenibacter elegans]